jgi:saccharopine dehydrogenase (NAD+, L-lysine-forming)
MLNEIPLFLDGKFEHVRQLEESGTAATVETTFRDIGTFPVYPYPHPETITLPTFLPGLKRATNLGVIFPLSYFHLTQDMVRAGTCGDQPMLVNGQPVVPIDFAVAHILSRRDELLREAGVTGPGGCLKVVVDGIAGGEPNRFIFSLSSQSAGAGEGTGIPAAAGAVMMARGEIPAHGVNPPEAVPNPFGILLLTGVLIPETQLLALESTGLPWPVLTSATGLALIGLALIEGNARRLPFQTQSPPD